MRKVHLASVWTFVYGLSTDNVLTNSKGKDFTTVRAKSVLFFGESSDGTRAEIAYPGAAPGVGVGAERTGGDGATNQPRGEELN